MPNKLFSAHIWLVVNAGGTIGRQKWGEERRRTLYENGKINVKLYLIVAFLYLSVFFTK